MRAAHSDSYDFLIGCLQADREKDHINGRKTSNGDRIGQAKKPPYPGQTSDFSRNGVHREDPIERGQKINPLGDPEPIALQQSL
jgi:hypothetical protein